jgi:Flp pilus assembly secretin CpaC
MSRVCSSETTLAHGYVGKQGSSAHSQSDHVNQSFSSTALVEVLANVVSMARIADKDRPNLQVNFIYVVRNLLNQLACQDSGSLKAQAQI